MYFFRDNTRRAHSWQEPLCYVEQYHLYYRSIQYKLLLLTWQVTWCIHIWNITVDVEIIRVRAIGLLGLYYVNIYLSDLREFKCFENPLNFFPEKFRLIENILIWTTNAVRGWKVTLYCLKIPSIFQCKFHKNWSNCKYSYRNVYKYLFF